MKKLLASTVLLAFFSSFSISQTIDPSQWARMVGYWNFDDPSNLVKAELGLSLEQFGTCEAVAGPSANDGATRVGVGDYFKCTHQINHNGGGSYVNEYTLVIDFKVPSIGQYYCFYQTNMSNSNDGEVFINPAGHVGITGTGYSYCTLSANEWYRLVISVDLGNTFNYYIDGELIHEGNNQSIDGRYSLDPFFHWFRDDNAEDNEFDIAAAAIFDCPLTAAEAAQLGGYGHTFTKPLTSFMDPYLQTVTTSSIYISWHSDNLTSTIVEYGTDNTLGQQTTGHFEDISGKKWHTVQLTGLEVNTEYFYHCISGADTSEISSFRTKKNPGTPNSHVRFVLAGDTRTDIQKTHYISTVIEDQLTEDYGEKWNNEVDFVINVGDIVETGSSINQYIDQYFLPYANLTDKIPFYVSIGNHEAESPNYYKYMKYEEMTGAPYDTPGHFNEKFYAFRYGNCQFIALNSNTAYRVNEQTEWLENILNTCESDPLIDFVFTFCHHPGHSEVWPDGNTSYVQSKIIPLLQRYSKPAMLIYGHTHAYEHGAVELDTDNPNYKSDMHILLSGGGGSPLDRWGMYSNQRDYDEIFFSLDHYDYSIVDVDVDDKSYTARTFSFGHPGKVLDNEIVDTWYSKSGQTEPDKPLALNPVAANDTIVFQGSTFSGLDSLMTSQIQVTRTPGDFSNPIIDETRDVMNVYGDSGAPDYVPIDLNEGIDITKLEISSSAIHSSTCGWRIRYRDHNLKWSPWSDEKVYDLTKVEEYPLAGNYLKVTPNPFSRKTEISFGLAKDETVSLVIYSIGNTEVEAILRNERLNAGNHSFSWSPKHKQPGVYVCRLVAGELSLSTKILCAGK
ncbi:MAG: metallophosphoesterase [Bacteroidales bacterium]|nr:metallophosphoesterase [Bacteroidales bacterium]